MDNPLYPPQPDFARSEKLIGITTTVPVEIVLAAGLQPVDLNNVFLSASSPALLVESAERAGFPRTTCCWIKGIFGAAQSLGIKRLIGVVQGDCSNTHALMESFQFEGGETVPFNYPYDRSGDELASELRKLADRLGTSVAAAEGVREALLPVREKLAELDRLTWETGQVSGFENHLWLVSSSDFCGDPARFGTALDGFLAEARRRAPYPPGPRVAYVGVPPICPEIYGFIEGLGIRILLNETQRQFSMPGREPSLVAQYLAYTYPYGIFPRIQDVKQETARRGIVGIIHYVQSFCFRQIEDHILRRSLGLRCLTLEFDRPGPLDGQTRTRIEAFAETLRSS